MKLVKLRGGIGWDITASLIDRILFSANGEDIKVEITTPGGYVIEGFEIFNLFKNYPGSVHFHIVGEASSMGSYIVQAGDKITAEANAVYFIHNARSYGGGDHNDHRDEAVILESMSNIMAKRYAKRTGKKIEEIKKMMDKQTYFFGDEMLSHGFIDEIIGEPDQEVKAERVALAQASFLNCVSKMKAENKSENFERAAALLKPHNVEDNEKSEPEATAPEQPRIDADNTKKEIINMSLEKIMAENPGVKAEVEALKTAAHNAGFEAGKATIEARIKKAAPVLGSQTYPHALKALAVKVLNGESGPDALEGAMAVVDMQLEQKKETAAKAEQKPDTPAATAPGITATGAIDSEDAYQATIAQAKKEAGRA